jgi:3-mercaptopyruvate sulfurtransferase SseA
MLLVAIAGAQKLIDAGFKTVYRLEGNYGAWKAAGYPIEMQRVGYSRKIGKKVTSDIRKNLKRTKLPFLDHFYGVCDFT